MDRFFVLAIGWLLLLAGTAGLGRSQSSARPADDWSAPDQAAAAQPAPEASSVQPSSIQPSPLPLPPPEVKPPPPKPVEKPARLEHMQKAQAESVLGESVLDAKGNPIGRIVDVLINAQGTPHAAVIEFAGFLGVGNRDIAVVWKALDFKVVNSHIVITLDLNAVKLKAMPTYTADAKSVPVAAPAAAKPPPAKAKVSGSDHKGETTPSGAR